MLVEENRKHINWLERHYVNLLTQCTLNNRALLERITSVFSLLVEASATNTTKNYGWKERKALPPTSRDLTISYAGWSSSSMRDGSSPSFHLSMAKERKVQMCPCHFLERVMAKLTIHTEHKTNKQLTVKQN